MTSTNRPSDIKLPYGLTWDDVEALRAKYDVADNVVPIATAFGVRGWVTINAARDIQATRHAAVLRSVLA